MIRSWMVIAAVTLLVALGGGLITPRDIKWFRRLTRPRWLSAVEPAIPVIWPVIFVCAAWSAYIVWENDPGSTRTWMLMGLYILVEIVTVAYQSVMLRLRSLKVGLILGGTGALLGSILALLVLPVSFWAFLLLVPYVIWSPIGTYATWQLMQLNPADV